MHACAFVKVGILYAACHSTASLLYKSLICSNSTLVLKGVQETRVVDAELNNMLHDSREDCDNCGSAEQKLVFFWIFFI